MQQSDNKTLEGVPLEFLLRLAEAFLADTKEHGENAALHERQFGGVPMKMLVNSHWMGFERFMLVGRDWQCGFNLGAPESEDDDTYSVFAANLAVTNPALNGKRGFERDMTVLRMTFSDWKLAHQHHL